MYRTPVFRTSLLPLIRPLPYAGCPDVDDLLQIYLVVDSRETVLPVTEIWPFNASEQCVNNDGP